MNEQQLQNIIIELQNGNDRQRRASSYKLSNSKNPLAVPALIHAYNDSDSSVRQNAIDGLRAISTQEAIDFLNSHNIESGQVVHKNAGSGNNQSQNQVIEKSTPLGSPDQKRAQAQATSDEKVLNTCISAGGVIFVLQFFITGFGLGGIIGTFIDTFIGCLLGGAVGWAINALRRK